MSSLGGTTVYSIRFSAIAVVIVLFFSVSYANSLWELGSVQSFSKGFAVTADTGKFDSAYKNPACLSGLSGNIIQSSYAAVFDNQAQNSNFGFGVTYSDLTFGLFVPVSIIPNIPETIDNAGQAQQIGSFSDLKTSPTLAVSKSFSGFSAGFNVAYLYQRVAQHSGSGLSFGLGAVTTYEKISLGASVQNIGQLSWTTGRKETLNPEWSLGLGFKALPQLKVLAEYQTTQDTTSQINTGLEWALNDSLKGCAGVQNLSNPQFSVGISLDAEPLSVDFGFAQDKQLGSIYKMGLSVRNLL